MSSHTKMLISWAVVFAATALAWYLGYRARSPKRFGGIIGTLLVFSFYGILTFIAMYAISMILVGMGVWKSGGDTDLGPVLTPVLMTPLYWIFVFAGMSVSKGEK